MFLVKMLKQLFTASIVAAALLILPSFVAEAADSGSSSSSGECPKSADFTEALKKSASTALTNCKTYRDKFVNEIKTTISNSDAPCNDYKTIYKFDGWFTSEWSWGSYDAKGAKVAELEDLFNSVQDFPDTDIDISDYLTLNNDLKKSYKSALTKAKNNGNTSETERFQKALTDLEKCENALLNLKETRKKLLDYRNESHALLTSLSKETASTCTCNEDGSVSECTVVDDSYVEDHVDTSECKAISDYVQEISMCPTCGLFETILVAVQRMASNTFDTLQNSLIQILMVALFIFYAFQTLKVVSSPVAFKISEFLKTLSVQTFKVTVAIGLLNDPAFIYNTMITPIIQSGFEFGLELLGDSKTAVANAAIKYDSFDKGDPYLSSDFLQNVVGAAEAFNSMAATMPAIGQGMMCLAWVDLKFFVFPHIMMLLEGLILYLFGLAICLAIGFYMLDTAIQLGLFCALLPFFVACWPFKITAKYTQVGWKMVLNTFFCFVMIGVVLTTANNIVLQSLSPGLSADKISEYINSNDVNGLEEEIDFGGLQLLLLIVCCMIVFKLIKDVNSLANKFEGGIGVALGGELGGTAASAATSIAKLAAGKTGAAAAAVGGRIAEASGAKGAATALKGKVGGAAKGALAGIEKAMSKGASGKKEGGSNENGNGDKKR